MKYKIEEYDIILHLSHTDLDGYGSQYVMNFIKTIKNLNIEYFNVNNYNETEKIFKSIFKLILNQYSNKKILLLITDLSIKENIAKRMNNFIKGNNIDLTYQVLDHHKTGLDISKENEWYKIDTNKCGTSLTVDFILENSNINKEITNYLKFIGNFIESHDLWKKDDLFFHHSNFLADLIYNFYFIDNLNDDKRQFIFNYIYIFTGSIIDNKNIKLIELEMKLPEILNKVLILLNLDKTIINNPSIRTLNKLIYFQSLKYKRTEESKEILTLNNDIKFIVVHNFNSSFFQYFSHYYLEDNRKIDFIINIKNNGSMSFRTIKKNIDVEKIAKIFDKNGGGHKEAAGCKIKFQNKNIYSYNEIIKEIKYYL
jgi:hypothetical protein